MGGKVQLFQCAVIIFICVLDIADSTIQIVADPPDINMIDAKPLTVKCTYLYDVNATNTLSLHSLTISKRGQVVGTFDILSELIVSNPHSPTQPHNAKDTGITSLSGHIVKDKGTSFLSLTWNSPSPKEAGTFACTAHSFDTFGVPTTELHETEIREDSILVIAQKLKSLQNQIVQQETCCNLATARLAEFDVWRRTVSTSLKFFAENLVFQRSAEYENSTYLVSNFTVDDIAIAEAVCQTVGGYLAEIEDAQEWSFVTSILNTTHFSSFYIGGRDNLVEGSWYWMHSRRPMTFAPWNKGEPNNSGGEDCLEIINISLTTSTYVWNDISCTIPKRNTFICEIPIN